MLEIGLNESENRLVRFSLQALHLPKRIDQLTDKEFPREAGYSIICAYNDGHRIHYVFCTQTSEMKLLEKAASQGYVPRPYWHKVPETIVSSVAKRTVYLLSGYKLSDHVRDLPPVTIDPSTLPSSFRDTSRPPKFARQRSIGNVFGLS